MMENSGLIDLRACIKLKVSNSICFPRLHHMHLIEWGHSPMKRKKSAYCPLDVCKIRVTSVEAPGHVQLFASNAYLNSSSQTTCSANFTCSLCSGLKIPREKTRRRINETDEHIIRPIYGFHNRHLKYTDSEPS